ncbi:MAG: hypothetical protein V1898_03215 [Patescibacteria group bacterium]
MLNCKNCQKQFEITNQDKAFYQSLNVPEPTWCSDCRNMRRMAIRNERTFYQRQCDCCKKNIIAYYPKNSGQVVYCPECWYSDKWSPYNYGTDFDFNRGFFEQFKELYLNVPTLSLDVVNCENSDYVSYCGDDKSCYFDIAGEANERCMYGKFIKYCKDCVDNSFVYHSELCYECVNCHHVYGSTWLDRCYNCDHCHYSYDLKGCSHCILCSNLRNKSYCINNKKVSKEEYERFIEGKNTYSRLQKFTELKKSATIKYANIINSENCTGDDIINSKNCYNCNDVTNSENSKWLYDVLDAKECYDLNFSLYKPEKSLELISTLNMINSKFCNASHYCRDMEYCDKCNNSHDCFGCIGITKGEYIILNKKYSEADYKKLQQKVISHMKEMGEYGQFFPVGTTGFKYNETVASEYYPQNNQAGENAHSRQQDSLPICSQCHINYKIIVQEREFYGKMNLEEPQICPQCRHKNRNIRAGRRTLYNRQCIKCYKDLKSCYKQEDVYCEECYQKVIY